MSAPVFLDCLRENGEKNATSTADDENFRSLSLSLLLFYIETKSPFGISIKACAAALVCFYWSHFFYSTRVAAAVCRSLFLHFICE